MTQIPTAQPRALSLLQILRFAAIGAAFWLIAALMLRGFIRWEMTEGGWRVVLYALTVPVTVGFLVMIRFAGAARGQMFAAAGVVTLTAALLDGLALGWARGLYGAEAARVTDAAGVLLWGVGLGLLFALWWDRRLG